MSEDDVVGCIRLIAREFGSDLDRGDVARDASDFAQCVMPKFVIWRYAREGDVERLRGTRSADRTAFLKEGAGQVMGELLCAEPSVKLLADWFLMLTRVLESIRRDRENKHECVVECAGASPPDPFVGAPKHGAPLCR